MNDANGSVWNGNSNDGGNNQIDIVFEWMELVMLGIQVILCVCDLMFTSDREL